ncbi:MAG: hypothetical protein IE881_06365 [Epsilonproteobacteria bacterium]|nr:hypothetical protein [Campylobacterota bacterium]
MNKIKVPFPRYLNAKKLFYRWEEDVIYIAAGSGAVSFILMLWFNIGLLIALFVSLGIAVVVLRRYIKYFKKARKGFVWHLLYEKGFNPPFNKDKVKNDFENSLIPFGFENEFIN